MNFRKFIIIVVVIEFVVVSVHFLQPNLFKVIQARFKSTDQFVTFPEVPGIHYEKSAANNALFLGGLLPGQKQGVEEILGASFEKPVEVYICATQESFNSYVYLSENVKGAVFWGKLFLSPGAFESGSLSRLVAHELTHYLFYTHLGEKDSVRNIPLWFREGIAVFVADGGAEYTQEQGVKGTISYQEKAAVLSGKIDDWFYTEDSHQAVTENGGINRLLYRVSGLFVHYIHDQNPQQFQWLIDQLLGGETFAVAIQQSFGKSTGRLWEEFSGYLADPPEDDTPIFQIPDWTKTQ